MMKSPAEWRDWEALWRAERASPARLEEMVERARRARRGLWLVRLLPSAVALFALALVGAALYHAGNVLEIALGVAVALGIVVVWGLNLAYQRDAVTTVEAPAEEYAATRRATCVLQMQCARLGLIVTALDLVFLVPWWIGGFKVHGFGFHVMQLLTLWAPLALMASFVWWALRLQRRARRELWQLSQHEG